MKALVTDFSKIGYKYIQLLGAPINKNSFINSVLENPYYPSLYSLSLVLGRFNIDSRSLRIEKEELIYLNAPFVAYIKVNETGNNEFVIVTVLNKSGVKYSFDGKNIATTSREQFFEMFKEVVLIANLNGKSGEIDYLIVRKKELKIKLKKIISLSLIVVIIVADFVKMSFESRDSTLVILLGLIESAGFLISTILVVYEIDKTNVFVKNICSWGGVNMNCDAVLNSKASKLFGIAWSEIGLIYFSSLGLFTLLPGAHINDKISILAIIFIIASFYIPFSIYYQSTVIKHWCRLCLATQCILCVALAWSVLALRLIDGIGFNFSMLLILAVCTIVPTIIWILLKPIILTSRKAKEYNVAYKRIMHNPDIFNGLLSRQQKASEGWENLGINIGNTNAQNTIIKVCNPYCGLCARIHPLIEAILDSNDNINLKMIFTATNHIDDPRNKPVRHFLSIAAKNDMEFTRRVIDDWYQDKNKNFNDFAAKYPIVNSVETSSKIELMATWCIDSNITYTPTIFVNGRRLPQAYDLAELKDILANIN